MAARGRDVAPDYWNIWAVSGKIAEARGDREGALAMYEKAFDLKPSTMMKEEIAKMQKAINAGKGGKK